MTQPLTQPFGSIQSALREESAQLTAEVKALAEAVLALLDGKLAHGAEEITAQLAPLSEALASFHRVVDHPEIIFATTGTTSSGKSTLVNLLCGAFIMPEAVGEMSAGVVEIEHGEHTSVEIFPTRDASWFIGRREKLSDQDLQALLTEVMHGYNDRREDRVVPECPRIKVVYPTRLGREISEFGLPPSTPFTLKILDLPGLKHVGDSQNATVINEYCRRAMSFVTYNAAETDPHKQESLLKQVVGQVKEIGGTPARMMFILNRFDVYAADSDPEASKARAFNSTQNKIRQVLREALPEYAAVAAQITPQRLATKPALLAERGDFREIERHFNYMIDEEMLNDLPRRLEKWSDEDRMSVAASVLKSSYVHDFRLNLRHHVSEHLPQILFPSPIAELKENALEPCLHKTAQQIQAVIETAKGDHQQSLRELNRLELEMKQIYVSFERSYKTVTELDPTAIPTHFVKQYSLNAEDAGRLSALGAFKLITEQAVERVIDSVLSNLIENAPFSQELLDMLPSHDIHLLNKSLEELKQVGYKGDFAKSGRNNYEEAAGRGYLARLNSALNQLSVSVAQVLPRYINANLNRESKRLISSINFMTEVIMTRLHERALGVVGDRLPLTSPHLHALNHDFKPITAHIQMSAGFSTTSTSRREHTGRSWEKVGTKRTWYTLWLGSKDVYDYVDKYEQRSYDNANIPSIYQVADGWLSQIEVQLRGYSEEIQGRVKEKLDESYAGVVTAQQQSIVDFKQRLEEASAELDQSFRDNIAPWNQLKTRLDEIKARVTNFSVHI